MACPWSFSKVQKNQELIPIASSSLPQNVLQGLYGPCPFRKQVMVEWNVDKSNAEQEEELMVGRIILLDLWCSQGKAEILTIQAQPTTAREWTSRTSARRRNIQEE